MAGPFDLTKAQRNAMLKLPDEFLVWPVGISRTTIKRLIEKGLLVSKAPPAGFGFVEYRWTPDGIIVRAALRARATPNTPDKEAKNA